MVFCACGLYFMARFMLVSLIGYRPRSSVGRARPW
jgi:hypothetical protein